MTNEMAIRIRLSAQRALWGHVPPSLRAASVDIDGQTILFRCIFDGAPPEAESELLSFAATEIIADFPEADTLDEELLAVPFPEKMNHLRFLVYLRHESANV